MAETDPYGYGFELEGLRVMAHPLLTRLQPLMLPLSHMVPSLTQVQCLPQLPFPLLLRVNGTL